MKTKMKFSSKLLLANISIIVILLAGVLFYLNYFLKVNEEEKFMQNLNALGLKTQEQIDILFTSMDTLALQIASNPYVISTFTDTALNKEDNIFETHIFKRNEVISFLNSYNFKSNLALRICLYNLHNDFVYAGYKPTDNTAIYQYFTTKEFDNVVANFKNSVMKPLYVPARRDPFSYQSPYLESEDIFSIIRPIKDYHFTGGSAEGYAEVQLPYSKLSDPFDAFSDTVMGFLIDDENHVIYPNDGQNITFDLSHFPQDKYIYSVNKLPQWDFSIVLVQEKSYLLDSYHKSRTVIIYVFLCLIILVTVTQFILIRYFTKPLIALQSSIEHINIENLSLKLSDDCNHDEFTQLNNAFSKMLTYLEASIQTSILSRTSELKSHLLALQAQMDPHFMHNILTVMGAIAEEHDIPKIEHMCGKLSRMLRFTTSYKQTHCALCEEILYTRHYLELMQERYENMFTFSLELPESANTIIVPKLIIQPLAENCFKHGFSKKPAPWNINIQVNIKDNDWFVTIEDNGVGFQEEFLKEFEQNLLLRADDINTNKLTELEIGGLCVFNIYYRLRLLYGNELYFTMENLPLGGASITIGGKINV